MTPGSLALAAHRSVGQKPSLGAGRVGLPAARGGDDVGAARKPLVRNVCLTQPLRLCAAVPLRRRAAVADVLGRRVARGVVFPASPAPQNHVLCCSPATTRGSGP